MKETLCRPSRIRKFNPGTLQSDEEVKNQFVVRSRELGVVLDVLRGNIGSPSCQHILLVAPRGRGKTMLLARVAAELRTDRALSERLLAVRFMEESQEIFSLADFWLESLFYLARECAAQDPELSRELKDVHAALAAEWHGRELEERARAAFLETTDRLGKQLVLMVENLQALCEHVDDDFGWKLRRVLQAEPQIILLATATSRFKGLDDAREPFFELFRILRLEPLDTGECQRLWRMVSGDTVSEREIRPLQILTGGDPRLLVIMGDFAQRRSRRQLMEKMVALIDEHTEYFRGHLEVFAKTERRVYLAVIDLWQPSSTGAIAARARMDVRAVSALLGRLVERGAVLAEGSSRKRKYAAAERLYSIYYKLRRERDEAAVVRNLIRFMAVFYTESELDDRFRAMTAEAAQWPAIRDGLMLAVGESPKISRIFSDETWPELEQISKRSAAIHHAHARGILDDIKAALGKDAFERVIEIADGFLSSESSGLAQAPDWLIAPIISAKAFAYEGLNEPEAGLAIYDEVIERFGSGKAPELQTHVAIVLLRKGITQEQLGEDRAAIATYDQAIERFGNSKTLQIDVEVARALVRKGIAQERITENKAAVVTFDEVTKRFGNSSAQELDEWVAKALVAKGLTLERLGESAAAVAAYDEAVTRFGDSEAPQVKAHTVKALVNMGFRQGLLGKSRAAISSFDRAVERVGRSDDPELQMHVAIAMVNKGVRLGELGETKEAIAAFDEVIERFGDDDNPNLQRKVANALMSKGLAEFQLGKMQEAICNWEELVRRYGDGSVSGLQIQVVEALFHKIEAQVQFGRIEHSLRECDDLDRRIEIISHKAKSIVGWRARWLRAKTLVVQQKHLDAMSVLESVFAAFDPGVEAMMHEMIARVLDLVANGASESDLAEMFSRDSQKADALLPLIVALRQRAGETVHAPAEALEVATDVHKMIEARVSSIEAASLGAPTS